LADLETTLRDLAARGELTHISLTPSGKGWRALYAPASTFANSFAEDKDPVKAILLACEGAKLRKRAPFVDGFGGRIKQTDVEVPAELPQEEVESLM
jgi:hypothetical protein